MIVLSILPKQTYLQDLPYLLFIQFFINEYLIIISSSGGLHTKTKWYPGFFNLAILQHLFGLVHYLACRAWRCLDLFQRIALRSKKFVDYSDEKETFFIGLWHSLCCFSIVMTTKYFLTIIKVMRNNYPLKKIQIFH